MSMEKATGLPESVRILNIPYRIKWVPHTLNGDDAEVLGLCSTGDREITISLRQTMDSAASTLVHEIFHAIVSHTGENGRKLKEEDAAILSELLLYSLFLENPELSDFIVQGINSAKVK